MAEKLQATVEQSGDMSVVKLAGFLDENNNLKKLVEEIPAGPIEIDLAGVERINSSGIRDWIRWLALLEAKGTQPVLVACSRAIVAQINLVKNFTGNGEVRSFQVPYHCRECDEEKVLLVETAEMSSPSEPPECPCPSCGRAMEVDEMPEAYFAFLGQLPARDSSQELARGSSAAVGAVKARVKTRERKSSPNARQSRPSLSVYQTPAHGTKRTSSNALLAPKRPSQPRMALGSNERISGERISATRIEFPAKPEVATPAAGSKWLYVLVVLLVVAIGALGYVVFAL